MDDVEADRDDESTTDGDDEGRRSAEDFARDHDPSHHDISAGEESRQPGDWTADDAGGPQVWDADGNLVKGNAPGVQRVAPDTGDTTHTGSDDRRTSSLDEIRDGGYGVGSAAPIDDGATPLGHLVKAWEDTKTFVEPDHPTYDEGDPHVWFTDADAARRAGFEPVTP